MSQEYAISIHGLEKDFSLNKNRSIKSLFIRREKNNKYKALDSISLNIEKGKFISIIGGNGSGKSTLLKIISGIYSHSRGSISVNGKVVSFIELGVGFNEDLSAKDNVFLNGAILGISKKRLIKEFDTIVDFAEVKSFMNQKLKTFSTGMKIRLAFSIAIKASADIYLIDEVLSVGDESFGKKCLLEFEKLIKAKKTIVLVSHSMELVKRMSNTVVIMEKGKIINSGQAGDMVKEYQKRQNQSFADTMPIGITDSPIIKKAGVDIMDQKGSSLKHFNINDNILVGVNLDMKDSLGKALLIFSIFDEQGRVIFAKNYADIDLPNKCLVSLLIHGAIGPGTYFINFAIFYNQEIIFQMDNANYFYIENTSGSQGLIAGLKTTITVGKVQ